MKPREWTLRIDGTEYPTFDGPIIEHPDTVHVIEKSAYDQLRKIADAHAADAMCARGERDELKAKYEVSKDVNETNKKIHDHLRDQIAELKTANDNLMQYNDAAELAKRLDSALALIAVMRDLIERILPSHTSNCSSLKCSDHCMYDKAREALAAERSFREGGK